MITKEQYLSYAAKEIERMKNDVHFASEPKPLFIDEKFNEENWNGVDIIRRFLYRYGYEEQDNFTKTYYYAFGGQHYLFVYCVDDFYIISWYKDRGKTDYIGKNGRPIDLDEYIELVNILFPEASL